MTGDIGTTCSSCQLPDGARVYEWDTLDPTAFNQVVFVADDDGIGEIKYFHGIVSTQLSVIIYIKKISKLPSR